LGVCTRTGWPNGLAAVGVAELANAGELGWLESGDVRTRTGLDCWRVRAVCCGLEVSGASNRDSRVLGGVVCVHVCADHAVEAEC